ncbi:MAG: hypothetical protein A2X52_04400 [Candidatus Rokubacteria bacterium GWC2_70_16]|nr:MAG: hypothetical protein A2X52_04400 [Candidatus Rokubacteria bacterium GWC2_70_16]OGL20112.1 MAG: hypothetical protein A3K12_03355 [Candidatus Rokubacteria bacterium RIFCSPLOWO2_12_FULL_71_19]
MGHPLSRRAVLKLGAYATAAARVLTPGISLAQAVVTATRGIVARDVQLTVGGTMIPAYEARPETGGPHPIVVLLSGFEGNHEHYKDVVRRFAHAGFYAISPELYHREGGMQGKTFQEMGRISGGVTRAQYLGDIRAALAFARGQPWARADRVGVTGFCAGGALALHFTAETPEVTAVAPWYGSVKRMYRDAPGVDAFSLVDRLKAPVLGLYGEADSFIPADDVRRFEAALKTRGVSAEFVLYPGAPHAFFSDHSPQAYRREAAEDAWQRCVAFFTKHLKA